MREAGPVERSTPGDHWQSQQHRAVVGAQITLDARWDPNPAFCGVMISRRTACECSCGLPGDRQVTGAEAIAEQTQMILSARRSRGARGGSGGGAADL
jgi:hypothetical protein